MRDSIVRFVDSSHQVEIVTSYGETRYLPQYKRWDGFNFFYAYYRIKNEIVSFRSLHQAEGYIKRSTDKKYRVKSYNTLNVLKRG